MLSSLKSTTLLLFLLLGLLTTLNAAFQLRQVEEAMRTTAADDQTTTPLPITTKSTKKSITGSTPSQQKVEEYVKNVKIIFPSDDEEESKFDVYGYKTTPPPGKNTGKPIEKVNATSEAAVIATTTVSSIIAEMGNSTVNATIQSLDDRLGILNLAPRCPDGQVIVNQRCHNSA